jgi:hypothetical protein
MGLKSARLQSFNFFKIVIGMTSIPPLKGGKMVEGIGLQDSILQIQRDVKRRGRGQGRLIPIKEYCKKDLS